MMLMDSLAVSIITPEPHGVYKFAHGNIAQIIPEKTTWAVGTANKGAQLKK